MARRLYITNAAPPSTSVGNPPKGAWDVSANAGDIGGLLTSPSGAAATLAQAETSATNNWDGYLATWVAGPVNGNQTIQGTVQWIIGVVESSASMNAFTHVHIWVSQGDSNTLRGTLLSDNIGATEWPTTATGRGEGAKTLTAVNALNGDYVVFEFGYQAQNTVTTSFTGTVNFGDTGADLTSGSTSVTTLAGWVEFSQDFLTAPSATPKILTLLGVG